MKRRLEIFSENALKKIHEMKTSISYKLKGFIYPEALNAKIIYP